MLGGHIPAVRIPSPRARDGRVMRRILIDSRDLDPLPHFGGRRLASITTADVNTFILKRRADLIVFGEGEDRKERNVRTGFFEREQITRIVAYLPPAIRPAVQLAYITGWRIPSEVLPLQWHSIDFEARVVRLDPHTTKNDEGRTFPFTDALEQLLEAQRAEHDRLKAEGVICPWGPRGS